MDEIVSKTKKLFLRDNSIKSSGTALRGETIRPFMGNCNKAISVKR